MKVDEVDLIACSVNVLTADSTHTHTHTQNGNKYLSRTCNSVEATHL
jgi:hypothetical protein